MIDPNDLERVAEFFDGNYEAAYRMAREVWLPETARTLERLESAIAARADGQVIFLCDHLREGARTVGAHAFVDAATGIERRYLSGQYARSLDLLADARSQSHSAADWLARRLDNATRNRALARVA